MRSFLAPKPPHPHAAMSIIVTADMGKGYEDGSQYHWEEPNAVNTTVQARIRRAMHAVVRARAGKGDGRGWAGGGVGGAAAAMRHALEDARPRPCAIKPV